MLYQRRWVHRKTIVNSVILLMIIEGICLGQIQIPEGTKIRLRLEQTLSSATSQEGQEVRLSVTDDVKTGDEIVIAQGATAVGRVVEAVPKRRMGRTGKIDFSVDRVISLDAEQIPVRYTLNKNEKGSKTLSTGILTAGTTFVFYPAGPFWLLRHGKDVGFEKGLILEVFTDQAHTMGAKAPNTDQSTVNQAVTETKIAKVIISSDVDGAKIKLDGKFVGKTPTTLDIEEGSHKILVLCGSSFWKKDFKVHGGSTISINAPLKRKKTWISEESNSCR
jgi:hypothetical protein